MWQHQQTHTHYTWHIQCRAERIVPVFRPQYPTLRWRWQHVSQRQCDWNIATLCYAINTEIIKYSFATIRCIYLITIHHTQETKTHTHTYIPLHTYSSIAYKNYAKSYINNLPPTTLSAKALRVCGLRRRDGVIVPRCTGYVLIIAWGGVHYSTFRRKGQ